MEIKDNELLRQFEITTEKGLVTIEYALQERKMFLTKFCENESKDEDLHNQFIANVLQIAIDKKMKVVPTYATFVKFFKKNKEYMELLPPGIKI